MNAVNNTNSKANLFSMLPTPAVSSDLSSQTDLTAKKDSGTDKSFDSALDKAREQSTDTKQTTAADNQPADKDAAVKDEVKEPVEDLDDADDVEDEVRTAVKSGEVLTLLTITQPVAAEPELEQPVAVQDPVAEPVEAIPGVEAIGQEADGDKGRTPLAMIQTSGSALAELLLDSANAQKDASLLNQLSGRYEGEVTIGQMTPVTTGDAQNIEGLLKNSAASIPDDLAAITAATAGRAMNLKQVQTNGQQPLLSAENLVTDDQLLDDSSALGLTNVKITEEAKSSLADNMTQTQTPQQELSQAIGLRQEQLKERLTNPEEDPEDKRTVIPQGILDDAGAKNPELYLTKAARQMGVRPEPEDKSHALAGAAHAQTRPLEIQPEQVQTQPQTARAADVYDIRQQILEQVRMIRTAQTTELVMQLKPEHLGQLTMKVSVANNGSVTAVFQSENAQVRAAIESQITQLKQELQQQGLKVDNVSVGAGLSEDFFTRSETQGQMGQFAQQQNQQAGASGATSRRIDRVEGLEAVEGVAVADNGVGAISTDAANPVNNATDTILDYRV